jgi:hypothetical protein
MNANFHELFGYIRRNLWTFFSLSNHGSYAAIIGEYKEAFSQNVSFEKASFKNSGFVGCRPKNIGFKKSRYSSSPFSISRP